MNRPNLLESPSYNQVKLRKAYHEFVVPFNKFAPLPSKSRMIKQLHHKRISMKDDDTPLKLIKKDQENEDEEDVPLALLAHKKGLFVPDKIEAMYPLIQHIPNHHKKDTQRNRQYHHYPSLILTKSEPLYVVESSSQRRQSSYF